MSPRKTIKGGKGLRKMQALDKHTCKYMQKCQSDNSGIEIFLNLHRTASLQKTSLSGIDLSMFTVTLFREKFFFQKKYIVHYKIAIYIFLLSLKPTECLWSDESPPDSLQHHNIQNTEHPDNSFILQIKSTFIIQLTNV